MADLPLSDPSATSSANDRLLRPIHAERHVRIICIGAGASGLLMAYKLQKHFQNYTLQIYDKNPEICGTWYENRYPGCACDVPSHCYTWSFEPKNDFSSTYPPSKETFDYFKQFANKYELRKYVKLQHQVVGAYWNDDRNGYDLQIKDLVEDRIVADKCDIFINAGGILNHWKWPDIPGLDKFEGPRLHTAKWDDSIPLDDKRVGLIGNGSSAIQTLPAIQPRCRSITNFIREPTWVSPLEGFDQRVFTEEERKTFLTEPDKLTAYRKEVESNLNSHFAIFIRDHPHHHEYQNFLTQQMTLGLPDEQLQEKLIPKWGFGCRRITPGINYLPALNKPNVEVVYGGVREITSNGCVSDNGIEYPLDVLICATGFDTTFRPRFPIINPSGLNLQDKWASDPESYLGVAVAGFPNYLTILGPGCPIGNGPVLPGIEAQVNWICKVLDRYQTTNIAQFSPKEEAVRDFTIHRDRFMLDTVWTEPCRSWYKSGTRNGPVTALWPGSTLHFLECMREVRFDDLDITYTGGNRFAWLGNGYSQTELDETADHAYYMRDGDDDPPVTTASRRRLLTKAKPHIATVTEDSEPKKRPMEEDEQQAQTKRYKSSSLAFPISPV